MITNYNALSYGFISENNTRWGINTPCLAEFNILLGFVWSVITNKITGEVLRMEQKEFFDKLYLL